MNSKLIGHAAAATAYIIFGFNIVMCKDIFNSGVVSPKAMFTIRMIVATALFWLAGLFVPKEKVGAKSLVMIAAASLVGIVIPQYTFLYAIKITTAIDTSILTSFTPIFTMIIAAIALKEPITLKKAGGVALSFIGVIILIMNSVSGENGVNETSPLGIVLLLVNGLSFASYLGIFRPLIEKYSVIVFMKWVFLFSLLFTMPFSLGDIFEVNFSGMPVKVGLEIAFVAVFATFVAYILIPIGQKHIRPTLVSLYSYLQPMIAAVLAMVTGLDIMTWQKLLAATLIITGVVFVNRSRGL